MSHSGDCTLRFVLCTGNGTSVALVAIRTPENCFFAFNLLYKCKYLITLHIDWRDDGVWMTGGTMHVFSGTLTQSFLDSLQ
jgi:hypothetical protein